MNHSSPAVDLIRSVPKDLAAYDRVRDLVAAGVKGLKIEGRLKNATYVAAATRVYREAIDAAMSGRPFSISAEREEDLAQGFSRGFTHGFLDGVHHGDLVHGLFPKSRGLRLGTVIGRTARGIAIEIDSELAKSASTPATLLLKPGDGVVFDEGRPDQDEQGGRVYSVEPISAPSGRRGDGRRSSGGVEVTFGRGDVKLAAVAIGSIVWKTDDPVIRRRIEVTYSRDVAVRREPLAFTVVVSPDRRITLRACDAAGQEFIANAAEPLQEAINRPLTLDMLREQFSRLGDTPFELGPVALVGPAGAGPIPGRCSRPRAC